jgi:hypothetical protein
MRSWSLSGLADRPEKGCSRGLPHAGARFHGSADMTAACRHTCFSSGCGGCLPPDPLAIGHDQQVVDGLKQAGVPPQAEPAKDRALGRQVGRQEAPGNAAAQDIEDRVEDLAGGPAARTSSSVGLGQERREQRPFGVGQIGFVTQAVAAILPPSGRGPHRASRSGFSTLLESRHPRPLNPFRDGLSGSAKVAMMASPMVFTTAPPCRTVTS